MRLSLRTVIVLTGEAVTITRRLTYTRSLTLIEAQNVTLVRMAARTITLATGELLTARRSIASTVRISTSEALRLQASFLRGYTITLSSPLKVTLQAVLHVAVTNFLNISVGIGSFVRLLARIVKARPSTWGLRAWEPSEELVAYEEIERNLRAAEPSATLEASKTTPTVKVGA